MILNLEPSACEESSRTLNLYLILNFFISFNSQGSPAKLTITITLGNFFFSANLSFCLR